MPPVIILGHELGRRSGDQKRAAAKSTSSVNHIQSHHPQTNNSHPTCFHFFSPEKRAPLCSSPKKNMPRGVHPWIMSVNARPRQMKENLSQRKPRKDRLVVNINCSK